MATGGNRAPGFSMFGQSNRKVTAVGTFVGVGSLPRNRQVSIVEAVMGLSIRRALWVSVSLAALCVAGPAWSAGGELSNAEIARLTAGQAVVREDTLERGGHR